MDPAVSHTKNEDSCMHLELQTDSTHDATMVAGESPFPDGGTKAWMTVLGGLIAFTTSIGYLSSFSIFQSYYSIVTLPDYSADQISWIGSLQLWGCFFFGILSGGMSDAFGPRVPVALGGFLLVLGTMMSSISTRYYQFMLSQGLCTAIGLGLIFTPALSIQSQWFEKRRGLAVGIVMSGQSLGGVIWPIVADRLLNLHGISLGWMFRVFGFVQLFLMTSSVLLLQRRLARDTKAAKFEMKGYFTNKSMVIFTAANFFFFLVLFIPYFFISLYGLQYGASDHEAFYLTAILNGSAFLGCLVLGVVADRSVGFFNTITAVAFACTITAAAWVAAQSFSGVVTWTVVYGFLAGGIQAIFSPCIALLVPDPELIGTWNGISMFVLSFPVLASGPVAGRMLANTGGTDYVPMQAFTGACLGTASVLYLVTRYVVSHKPSA
ncbi:monocarboxylate transporter [Purpureocillium lilacinum]|uniref:Monocarboxylate transporter n=1 Tax=Purpureocillium lilacinum TaxID=33203 RepID=A0A2U3ED87_PURLI|nr:monocarboxylate transporter [Purpureocillium lilacinum]